MASAEEEEVEEKHFCMYPRNCAQRSIRTKKKMDIEFSLDGLTTLFEEWLKAIAETKRARSEPGCGAVERVSAEMQYRELGYDWGSPGVYQSTGCNGTHHAWFCCDTRGTPEEIARYVLSRTRDFPGWREMHLSVYTEEIRVGLHGGRYGGISRCSA